MMFNGVEDVLVIAPHADDAEIGCGGTIARMVEEGKKVTVAVFCTKAIVIPAGMEQDCWNKEQKKSAKFLKFNLTTCNYRMRRLHSRRQDVLEQLVRLKEFVQPDLVFVPSTFDIHQDHKTVSEESVRAFKNITTLGYELFWNHIGLHQTQCFIKLSQEQMEKKLKAIALFESQSWRPFFDPKILEGHARCCGVQIGEEFAEGFEVIRWVIR